MPRFALKTPYLIVVICLMIAILGGVSVERMPVDMFLSMNIPVVVVATFYPGMPPEQIDGDITFHLERFFTFASGIDHIESRSLNGVSIIRVYFQSTTNADIDAVTIADLAVSDMKDLPPGTFPPVVLKSDASSLASDLRTSAKTVRNEHHAKDDAFESHDQHASLAQSTLDEQLSTLEVTHTGIGDDFDAFFNKYGTGDLGGWIPVFLKIVAEKIHLQSKAEFPHVDPNDDALVTTLPDKCKLFLVADWGAHNDHAANIRDLIKKETQEATVPVYFVHLGDIYYSGTRWECIRLLSSWPLSDENGPIKGKSFALNGNHEMYSGGDGYFSIILPQLGQKASYFVLRSPKWDFYGLDTAYVPACFHSSQDARLDVQWTWLKKQMDSAADRKRVFLTHYQPCSANLAEHEAGQVLRDQLAELQTGGVRPVEGWFFGHQHKCGVVPWGETNS